MCNAKRKENTCNCPAYPFPHREGGGACGGEDATYCEDCGEQCDVIKVDEGIGWTEAWGVRSCHHDYQWVSDCCHAGIKGKENNWGEW